MIKQVLNIVKNSNSKTRGLYLHIEKIDNITSITINISKKGHMPVIFDSPTDSVTLICVGHLYAYRATTFVIEESLELLVRDYSQTGVEGVRDALGGGIYALIIIDLLKQYIFVITDLFSCMPFFYRNTANGVQLGINQFDVSDGLSPSALACAEYLTFGYLPFHPSLFSKVMRLGPGQVLKIPLDAPKESIVTKERFPSYPSPNQRIINENEACEQLDILFTRYFSRLGDESIASGLSGGYDSRLIAAYCQEKNINLVTFDNPQTKESEIAKKVAEVLGKKTSIFQIPSDAPSRFAEDFFFGTGTSDSFESSHVTANLSYLSKANVSFIIDGYIGDAILGSGYYYKMDGTREPAIKVLLGMDSYLKKQQSDEVYLKLIESGYGRRIDGLPKNLSKQLDQYIREESLLLISELRKYCTTDADMTELLTHRFRGSLLISGGPVTFMRRILTLCPFYDEEIFTTCMKISKSLRAGDRLYNTFYRQKFPELAGIEKENTGGRATQKPVSYRLSSFKSAFHRRMAKLLPVWMNKNSKAGGHMDNFYNNYFNSKENLAFFDATLDRAKDYMKALGLDQLLDSSEIIQNKVMYLRLVSLGYLLTVTENK